jgi:hypothetical protein
MLNKYSDLTPEQEEIVSATIGALSLSTASLALASRNQSIRMRIAWSSTHKQSHSRVKSRS